MDLPRAPASLDAILDAHAPALGKDRVAYAHHCHRVFAFARLLDPAVDPELLALTCAFHDLGIWTAGTFDYLGPSVALAKAHLEAAGAGDDAIVAVSTAIEGHHKLTRHRVDATAPGTPGLPEAMRRADWADVTWGLRRFGLPRAAVRAAYAELPDAGFHGRLVALSWQRFLRHPRSPLPMLRW